MFCSLPTIRNYLISGAFWDTKFGVSNTELDKVQETITSHYDQEISDTQASYDTLIDEANAFYDGLQAATDAGLAQLRASREADFDNMELLMLEEKVSLEQAHAAGLISVMRIIRSRKLLFLRLIMMKEAFSLILID